MAAVSSGVPELGMTVSVFEHAIATGSLSLDGAGLSGVPAGVFLLADPAEAASVAAQVSEAQGRKNEGRWWEGRPLAKLNLSNNPDLCALDDDGFCGLTSLESFRADRCGIERVSAAALGAGGPAMRLLCLSSNRITALPAEGLATLSGLGVLDLSKNRLEEVPSLAACAPSLERLLLAGNALTAMPCVAGMRKLVELDVSANRIASVLPPDGVAPAAGSLPSLRRLLLADNQLRGRALGDLLRAAPALSELDARGNHLTAVPPLPPLLDTALFGRNNITDFPAEALGGAAAAVASAAAAAGQDPASQAAAAADAAADSGPPAALTVLDVSDNKLRALPDLAWLGVPGLATLDLRNNDLRVLPPALAFLPGLKRLPLSGNPLRAVRRSLLEGEGGAAALLRWLRTRAAEGAAAVLDDWSRGAAAAAAAAGGVGALARGADPEEGVRARREAAQARRRVGGRGGRRDPSEPDTHAAGAAAVSATAWAEAVAASAPGAERRRGGVHSGGSGGASADGVDWLLVLRDAAASGTLDVPKALHRSVGSRPTSAVDRRGGLGASGGPAAAAPAAGRALPLPSLLFDPDTLAGRLVGLRTVLLVGRALTDAGAAPLAGLPASSPRLSVLDLSDNALTSLPPCVAALPYLASLRASRNSISSEGADRPLMGEVDGLPERLTELDLSGNRLTVLPALMGVCLRLRVVRLANNDIELPPLGGPQGRAAAGQGTGAEPEGDEAAMLLTPPALEVLDVGCNAIDRLPLAVAALPRLRELVVENNAIRRLPPALGLARSLRDLRAAGNPQRAVRHDILARGGAAVMEHLRAKVSAEALAAWRAAASEADARLAGVTAAEEAEASAARAAEAMARERAEAARLGARPGDFGGALSSMHEGGTGAWGAPPAASRVGARARGPAATGQRCAPRDGSAGRGAAAAGTPARSSGAASAAAGERPGERSGTRGGEPRREAGGAARTGSAGGGDDGPPVDVAELEGEMERLQAQLAMGGVSRAQQFALKKKVAMLRAAVIRARRAAQ
ncbi:hypothetical protein FNF29_05228 [Cafeteria roenbergensis]|uniref:Uncharacterized protein n=1 Tax=Cafeteria roenbergensis TaxID=33653 RepID=A0A5A8CBW9_CAFRO|nr:hypothetical protein FNF29_05228 [Cafeteria roenbergensis]|eukprot:KAA0150425.1 hypothetical protein FNF29_05228 [Cafeteria roenbergensis]